MDRCNDALDCMQHPYTKLIQVALPYALRAHSCAGSNLQGGTDVFLSA